MAKVAKPSDIKESEFALVRFGGKRSVLYYVGQVIDVFEDGDVTFRFLKRSCQSTSVSERPTYILPKDTDSASEFTQNLDDIVFKLPAPANRKGTKRCHQKFVFPVDLSVTVVALKRFELRFVVASSRCRVSAFTCALASERVIAKCMLLVMTSHCLLLLHHLSLCQPKFVLFGFWITNRQHHYFSFFCSTSQSTSKRSSFKFKVMFQQR